jgi:hypothetical protein
MFIRVRPTLTHLTSSSLDCVPVDLKVGYIVAGLDGRLGSLVQNVWEDIFHEMQRDYIEMVLIGEFACRQAYAKL